MTQSHARAMRFQVGLILLIATISADKAKADVVWDWSFATEAGHFVTDGSLVGGVALPATYNILDFELTQTAQGVPLGSLLGGQFFENLSMQQGFIWDGTMPTQFFRGGFTNGSNFFVNPTPPNPTDPEAYTFFAPSPMAILTDVDEGNIISPTLLTLKSVPLPAAAWMGIVMLGSLGATQLIRRRRLAA